MGAAVKTTMCECGTDAKSKVMQSWEEVVGDEITVRRRRKCPGCGALWHTAEIPWDLFKEVMGDD